jgi:polysaccharide export outer membrane protein
MTTGSAPHYRFGILLPFQRLLGSSALRGLTLLLACLFMAMVTGCETPTTTPPSANVNGGTGNAASVEVLALKPGDVIKVGFPSVPSMDSTQAIRPDGKLSLPMLGDVVIAGKTTEAVTKELIDLYSNKLVSKEVTVSLVSSAYAVYITGAVLRPGKIMAERRITVFDAIMEAGGFDKAKADLKAVVVIREEDGKNHRYTFDLQKIFSGEASEPFYLKPFDTVFVPEKFTWF